MRRYWDPIAAYTTSDDKRVLIVGVIVMPLLLVASFAVPIAAGRLFGAPWWSMLVAHGVFLVAWSVFITAVMSKSTVRQVIIAHRKANYCASCGYHLLDVPAEADGCTVCPECGAAWLLGGMKSQ